VKPSAIIVDIDGTLADCSHRLKYFQSKPKDWPAFEAGQVDDKPIDDIRYLVTCMREVEGLNESKIIFVTGRNERTRRSTDKWLQDYVGMWVLDRQLLMRPDKDYRQDFEVKRDIYRDQIRDCYEVRFVLEDRQQCVDMWRAEGLTCLQVAKGDY